MTLEEAKEKYKGEWIAFRASGKGDNPEGAVVLHKKSRREFGKILVEQGLTNVYVTFAGPIVPERYSIMVSV